MDYPTFIQVTEAEEYLSKGGDVLFVREEMSLEVAVRVKRHHEGRLRCKVKVNHPYNVWISIVPHDINFILYYVPLLFFIPLPLLVAGGGLK